MSKKIEAPYPRHKEGAFVLDTRADVFDFNFKSNPHANELEAEVVFKDKSAGPPGHVHGGCQAAVLDEIMGSTGWFWGYAVVAGSIEVKFLKMIPINKKYTLRGKITKIEGRKIYVHGSIFDENHQIYATSTGVFIQLTDDQKQKLKVL